MIIVVIVSDFGIWNFVYIKKNKIVYKVFSVKDLIYYFNLSMYIPRLINHTLFLSHLLV